MRWLKRKQQGFSLVELMVSLVIGMIILIAITQVFLGSHFTYSMQTGLSKLQENGRFAMNFLTRDLRQAGYRGCTTVSTEANALQNAAGVIPEFLQFSQTLTANDNIAANPGFNRPPVPGSDSIAVYFADAVNSCNIDNHNVAAASIRCQAPHGFNLGDVLVASNCTHTAVFQKADNDDTLISHNMGAVAPGNCTSNLGSTLSCGVNQGTPYTYNDGVVMPMRFYRYYIAENAFGEPALYREAIANIGGAAALAASELVEGVENLQILYGEDTSGDGVANYYVPFPNVASTEAIISLRISIIVRSFEDNLVQGGQALLYNGQVVNFNDGRLRKVFTSTIAIRNRL